MAARSICRCVNASFVSNWLVVDAKILLKIPWSFATQFDQRPTRDLLVSDLSNLIANAAINDYFTVSMAERGGWLWWCCLLAEAAV